MYTYIYIYMYILLFDQLIILIYSHYSLIVAMIAIIAGTGPNLSYELASIRLVRCHPRQASEEEAGMLFGLTQDGKAARFQAVLNCAS